MSLKPKKKSDLKKIEAKMKAKESKMNTRTMLPPYTMIISEGIKTEPIYLRGFVSRINYCWSLVLMKRQKEGLKRHIKNVWMPE